uniref:Uncharacterized protein n=1 Tax=viral metagenome TaxID=1070528 RepID=A0A6C0H5Z1_9ZZZZ
MKIWKIIGYALILFIFFIFFNKLKTKEGLTSGSAGSASNFNDEIKAKLTLLQDELLISKYRNDYEDILTNMETYVNLLILKKTVNLDATNSSDVSIITDLNSLKTSINSSMNFIDTQ